MSQHETVLQMLRDAGPRGIHTSEIYAAFIANPSERYRKLLSLGHEISSTPERLSPDRAMGARYILVREAEEASGTTAGEPIRVSPTAGVLGAPPPNTQRTVGHAAPVLLPSPSHAAIAPSGPLGSLFDADAFVPSASHWKQAA